MPEFSFPENLFYDLDNQIWYEPLPDGAVRVGFTPFAVSLMGDVLVFTPKRIGRDFEPDRSFATIEGGKWIGSARAAFAGAVVGHNDVLTRKPEILQQDAFGEGWMLLVRPKDLDWRQSLISGPDVSSAFEVWLATGAYKDRQG